MALMTSATEILMQQAVVQARLAPFAEIFRSFGNRFLGDMLDDPRKAAKFFRLRRAPQTDDMRQMLDDLGVTPANLSPSRRPADRFTNIRIVTRSVLS